MTRRTQAQLLLVVLILGFLTGPRVMRAFLRVTEKEGITSPHSAEVATSLSASRNAATSTAVHEGDPYGSLHLSAKSVFVWDIKQHKKLYGKNEYVALPLASVTKMMMAVVAKEILRPDQKITIRAVDLSEDGDTGLRLGEEWSFEDLLQFTLVASSNDGASAIAGVAGASIGAGAANMGSSTPLTNKKLFIAQMNEKAAQIGLTSTYFLNESGLDVESLTSGAHGSARDMAMLFEYVFRKHPDLFTSTAYKALTLRSDSNIVHHVANTNQGVEHVSGMIGSKTGYTDLAGGNLVVVVDIGIDHPVVIAVLGSTYEGRFADIDSLMNATVDAIAVEPALAGGAVANGSMP